MNKEERTELSELLDGCAREVWERIPHVADEREADQSDPAYRTGYAHGVERVVALIEKAFGEQIQKSRTE